MDPNVGRLLPKVVCATMEMLMLFSWLFLWARLPKLAPMQPSLEQQACEVLQVEQDEMLPRIVTAAHQEHHFGHGLPRDVAALWKGKPQAGPA